VIFVLLTGGGKPCPKFLKAIKMDSTALSFWGLEPWKHRNRCIFDGASPYLANLVKGFREEQFPCRCQELEDYLIQVERQKFLLF
jgi:hypothetical protein